MDTGGKKSSCFPVSAIKTMIGHLYKTLGGSLVKITNDKAVVVKSPDPFSCVGGMTIGRTFPASELEVWSDYGHIQRTMNAAELSDGTILIFESVRKTGRRFVQVWEQNKEIARSVPVCSVLTDQGLDPYYPKVDSGDNDTFAAMAWFFED
jgi:hypothetical protein